MYQVEKEPYEKIKTHFEFSTEFRQQLSKCEEHSVCLDGTEADKYFSHMNKTTISTYYVNITVQQRNQCSQKFCPVYTSISEL